MIVYAVIVSRLASRLARRRIALHLDADYCTKPLAQVIALTVMCNAVGQGARNYATLLWRYDIRKLATTVCNLYRLQTTNDRPIVALISTSFMVTDNI